MTRPPHGVIFGLRSWGLRWITVLVRYENVLELLEFLGYQVE
jgi:hypothetical protein